MWKLFISLRYLFARRRQRFISIISVISVLGVGVGVAALIVVLSIMSGFDEEIKDKIIGTYAHIVITGEKGIFSPERVIAEVKKNPEVLGASPFVEKQVLLKTGRSIVGALARGIDPATENETSNIRYFTGKRSLEMGMDGVIIGSELANNLGLSVGDTIQLIFPENSRTGTFTITDTFTSGRYDYDANIVCVNLGKARELSKDGTVTGVGVKVKNEYSVPRIKDELQETLGFGCYARTWMDLDKNLMKALAMEKKMMFIVLGLIVIVACFNISGSLIMMVMEKTKDIGVMRALGATSLDVGLIFLAEGILVGAFGALLGFIGGVAIAKNINPIADAVERLTGFNLFPNDIYYFSEIPSRVNMSDIMSITIFAIALSLISGIYPALSAARLDPTEAIRYE